MEKNALLNKNIWTPRNIELYQIGSMIFTNAKDGDWGITVWRFVSYFLLFYRVSQQSLMTSLRLNCQCCSISFIFIYIQFYSPE
jgi:hypothetical protein